LATPIPFIGGYVITAGQNTVNPTAQVNNLYYGGSTNPSNSNGKFATATLSNGVVTLSGDSSYGNNPTDLTFLSSGVSILAVVAEGGFVAIKNDGSLQSFGDWAGGSVKASGVTQIAVAEAGWVALKNDGSLVFAGAYQSNAPAGSNFVKVFAGGYGCYAALTSTGTLFTWGYGASPSQNSAAQTFSGNFQNVAFAYGAGIAQTSSGSEVIWGSPSDGLSEVDPEFRTAV
jgi:hypothetical protein